MYGNRFIEFMNKDVIINEDLIQERDQPIDSRKEKLALLNQLRDDLRQDLADRKEQFAQAQMNQATGVKFIDSVNAVELKFHAAAQSPNVAVQKVASHVAPPSWFDSMLESEANLK